MRHRGAATVAKGAAKLDSTIARACGGRDKICGSGDVGEDSLRDIGWNIDTCPNLTGGPCAKAITSCADITTCLQCIAERAVDGTIDQTYGVLLASNPSNPKDDKVLNKCQSAIGKAVVGFLAAKSKALGKCWDAVSRGNVTTPCPDGKTQAAIAKAGAKQRTTICKACGGSDKACGGAVDLLPSTIGFTANCPAVTPPGGPPCAQAVTTLDDLVACVDCVAEFNVDCADRAAVPQLAKYPDACEPGTPATLTLPATATPTGVTVTPTPTVTPVPVSVDFTADGYFTKSGGISTFHPGVPPTSTVGYLALPGALTHAQLAQLQQDCVDRINLYRSGGLTFTSGTTDPGVPKPALTHLMGNDVCSSDQALGDLFVNNGAGGCAGAHTTAFTCLFSGGGGQNTCCSRSGTTSSAIRSQLYSCLQQMWDEGIGLPDDAPFTSSNGHWYNMRNANFGYLHCGFAFNTKGSVWMNQDFSRNAPAGVPLTCSCVSKNVGDPDGCGGTCVTAN